ncbi:hypothetical protein BGZ65_001599 [Modicella reniformis]|uniref:SCP2 domain-containing protein n=1 Tax=Modicella reniformis TaxID=1440133 RepID=A0A9P6J6D2_9FUNG|nr:hypothetical protein BGZ65_001599 [Modicella reniformis]
MSNKPSAKTIARLNATTLFPEIRKEIEKNPSLFAIRGFFIFNITKKGVPMTEWYMLFQGFDAPAIVSQKRPEIPKAKQDQQPIPVAIVELEDKDLLNFMSGGLTGSRGIVNGKIKIAGAMELAEELEQIFRKAKGSEKTLAYLDQKRGKSERAKARLSSSEVSEGAKKTGVKVQGLARRYSALAKQASSNNYVPKNNLTQPGANKESGAIGKSNSSAGGAAAKRVAAKAPDSIEEEEKKEEESQESQPVDLVDDETPSHKEEPVQEQKQEPELVEEPKVAEWEDSNLQG